VDAYANGVHLQNDDFYMETNNNPYPSISYFQTNPFIQKEDHDDHEHGTNQSRLLQPVETLQMCKSKHTFGCSVL